MFDKLADYLTALENAKGIKYMFIMHGDGYWEIRSSIQGHVHHEGDGEGELLALINLGVRDDD